MIESCGVTPACRKWSPYLKQHGQHQRLRINGSGAADGDTGWDAGATRHLCWLGCEVSPHSQLLRSLVRRSMKQFDSRRGETMKRTTLGMASLIVASAIAHGQTNMQPLTGASATLSAKNLALRVYVVDDMRPMKREGSG